MTTAIAPMRRWRGNHRTPARRRVPHRRVSIRIAGGRTVVGCIRRRSRRDVHTHTPRAAGAAGGTRKVATCRLTENGWCSGPERTRLVYTNWIWTRSKDRHESSFARLLRTDWEFATHRRRVLAPVPLARAAS